MKEIPAKQDLGALDDATLLTRYVQHNDRGALETLFRRHANMAYATARRVCRNAADAQDAVQNAFIKVMRNASAFRGGSEKAVQAWVTKIVIGTCKDKIRSEVRRRNWEERAMGEQDDVYLPNDTSAAEDTHILAATVLRTLNEIPEHYRLPIWLHHYQGLSLKDTASALSVSEHTLHTQLKRGMRQLRGHLTTRGVTAGTAALITAIPLMQTEAAPDFFLAGLGEIAQGTGAAAETNLGLHTRTAIPLARRAVAALLLTGAVSAGIVLWNHEPGPLPPETPLIRYRWDFNTPTMPKEFKVLRGEVRQVPANSPDGDGYLVASNALIRIDIPITNFPFVVRFRATAINPRVAMDCFLQSYWLPARSGIVFMGLSDMPAEAITRDGKFGEWHTYSDYYSGQWLSRWKGKYFHEIYIVPMHSDGRVTLRFRPVIAIDYVTIESIAPDAIPDPTIYLQALEDIPPEKRKGVVPVPSLKAGRSTTHDKHVYVKFFTNLTAFGEAALTE